MTNPISPALQAAAQDVNVFNNNQRVFWQNITKGATARLTQNGQPAFAGYTAEEYISAQGTANIAALTAVYGPAPTA